ncbi:MAG TPA: ParA family protein, partial [Hyphomicrobiaceae bacterium]|nr:ParA family protein [Hyphomicrobiaceae bacterium]
MAAINFKGGTGKTTVAIAIAEGICRLMGKRVAVIDCDFQCSASIAMLGRRTLNDLMRKNATMDSQLQSALSNKKNVMRFGACAVPAQFCVSEAAGLMHVLPGSHEMPRRERQIAAALMPRGNIHNAYENAAIKMGEVFRSLLDEFDFVLIDCPPGLTLFSEAAIRAADGLIIPTLPNEISFTAIDHLRAEIARARPDRSFDDMLIGTVVSKVRQKAGSASYRAHMETIERLLDRVAPQFQLLKPYLPYCKELEGATWRDNDESRINFATRYGSSSLTIERLVQEFADRCSELMVRQGTPQLARRQPA